MAARKSKIENISSTQPWWEEILRGQRSGLFAESVRRAAQVGSWGYKMGVRGREMAYESGLLRVKRLPRPTVCVGNITVGGTGKTPLVMRLVSDLLAKGCRPAVLLRGYKRERTTSQAGFGPRAPKRLYAGIQESGDEAMELAMRLPGACVGVGADRYASGMMILKQFPVDCFIMDDGFQHYQLHRDLNIVTLDVTDPPGAGATKFPGRACCTGISRKRWRRAHLVILTRAGLVSPDRLGVLRAEVSTFLQDHAALLESRHEPRSVRSLADGKQYSAVEAN